MLDCRRPYWGLGMKTIVARSVLVLPLLMAACASPPAKPPSASHLSQTSVPAADTSGIPPTVRQTLAPPRPKSSKGETYSVVVNNVRVHDLLFALARDAKVNVDVHPGIQGNVTLNAVDQTLPQILNRLAKQIDMRWEVDGQNLAVMPDTPFLRNYRIDYVNMSRDTTGSVAVSTQITSSVPGGSGASGGSGGSSGGGNNNSTTTIDNKAKNHFWETLIQNVKDILRETDKILPDGSSDTVVEQESSQQGAVALAAAGASGNKEGSRGGQGAAVPQQASGTTTIKRTTFREAASVIAHPESGTLAIRASSRQHEKIQEFLDQVMASARRQVLIEATVAEVELTQEYQQGINWGEFSSVASRSGVIGRSIAATGSAQLVLGRNSSGTSDLAIRLLETFGTVKVVSSPKISVLNNQPAVLKVVDNQVYFSVKVETNQNANNTTTNVTTTAFSVPIGFVMNVSPQIGENDTVLLNLRPSISRQVGTVSDPNPELKRLSIENLIPVIRTRELESIMRVEDGQTAVLGGLMEDSLEREDSAVPWFHSIPLVGALFAQKRSASKKTELVVFIRPTVVQDASFSGDFARLRKHLPDNDFFNNNKETRFQLLPTDTGDEKK
jgi:MSHA type pilus biogenesis protein MshL